VIRFLSIKEFAASAGVSVDVLKGLRLRGLLPDPDAAIGRYDGWSSETVDAWVADRQGR
jgi:predicted DNA-binding transcriptional regulator AlpA